MQFECLKIDFIEYKNGNKFAIFFEVKFGVKINLYHSYRNVKNLNEGPKKCNSSSIINNKSLFLIFAHHTKLLF